jgi:hypothetical protein
LVVSLHPYSEGTRANPAYFAPDADNGCAALHTGWHKFILKPARDTEQSVHINLQGVSDVEALTLRASPTRSLLPLGGGGSILNDR